MQAAYSRRNTYGGTDLKKHEIYTNDFIQAIKRKLMTVLVKYIAIAALFAALCVTFCLLAAFDLVNVYVCCALNIVFTIAFLWFTYLFFTIYFKKAKEKRTFVKCLENAYPSIYEGALTRVEQEEEYFKLFFQDGNVLKLDVNATVGFIEGNAYRLDVVDDVIISYCEAENE